MKTRTRLLITSILSIVCCVSMIVGATLALFTSESKVNIAVTAGKVEVLASVDVENAHVFSAKEDESGDLVDENGYKYSYEEQANLTFKNGGTVAFNGNEVTISKVTPGDKVTFPIKVINNDNVTAKYRTYARCVSGPKLFQGLNVTIADDDFSDPEDRGNGYNVYSEWDVLNIPSSESEEVKTVDVTIEFPITAGNQYQNLSTKILYGVEAIQGNAHTENYESLTYAFYDNMDEDIKATATADESNPEKGTVTLKDEYETVSTVVPDVNPEEEYTLKASVSDSITAHTFTLQGVNSNDPNREIEQITYEIAVVDKDGNHIEERADNNIKITMYAGLNQSFVALFHHVEKEDGSIETIQIAGMDDYDPTTGEIVGFTNSFSDYTLVKCYAPVVIIDELLNVKLYTSIQEAIDDSEEGSEITINYLIEENEEVVIDKPVTIKTAENGIKDEEGKVVSPIVNSEGEKVLSVKDVEFVVEPEVVDMVFDIDVDGGEEVKRCEEHNFTSEILDGYVTYTCSECGFSYTKKFDTETVCAHDSTLTHLSWVDKEVSCLEGADEFVRCIICDKVIINHVEPIGHDYTGSNTCINVCNGELCGAGSFKVEDTYYTTLKDAVTAANNGKTVTLENPSFNGNGVITGVEDVTIDLCGNTWTSTNSYALTVYDCDGVTIKNGTINASNVAFRIGEHQYTIVKWQYKDQYPLYGYHPLAPAKNVSLEGLNVTAGQTFSYTNIEDDLTRGNVSNPVDRDLYGRYIYKTGYMTQEQSDYGKYDEVFTECTDKDSIFVRGGSYISDKMVGNMVDVNGNLYTDVLTISDGTFSNDGLGRYVDSSKYLVGSNLSTKKFEVSDNAPIDYKAKVNNVYYTYEGGAVDAILFVDFGETVYLKESANVEKEFATDDVLTIVYEVDNIAYTGAYCNEKYYEIKTRESETVEGGIEFYSIFEPVAAVYATGQGGSWKGANKVGEYATLIDAFRALSNNYTVVILKDVEVGDEYVHTDGKSGYPYGGGRYQCAVGYASRSTVDFNGHVITYTGSGACIVTSQQTGYLFFKDTSATGNGGITATNGGTCIRKMNSKSDYTDISGGNYISTTSAPAIQITSATGFTISGGRFISAGSPISGSSGLSITGGTFSSNLSNYSTKIKAGMSAVDNGDGTWTVKKVA